MTTRLRCFLRDCSEIASSIFVLLQAHIAKAAAAECIHTDRIELNAIGVILNGSYIIAPVLFVSTALGPISKILAVLLRKLLKTKTQGPKKEP